MTKQQPNGQKIRRYTYHTSNAEQQPVTRRRASRQPIAREETPEGQRTPVASNATRRKVDTDQKQIPPLSWSERRDRRGRVRDPQAVTLVPRRLSQTGQATAVPPRRVNKPLPRQRPGTSVPKRRQRHGLSRFWRRLFGLLAVLSMLGVGVSFALRSSTFHIQQVHIVGTQNAGLISAIQRMGIQGQDIFLLNQASIIARLEALPLVDSASISIELPNNITVTIQERVPVLLWQSGQSTYGIAQDGVVIAPLSELSGSKTLATIVDKRQQVARLQPGTRVNAAQIAFAQQLLQRLPGIQGVGSFTLQYVDRITDAGSERPANQAGAGCYIVISSYGWLAYMGDAVNQNPLENRLLELQQILDNAQQAHLQLATIDLRFGLRPTYTLKS